VKPTKVELLTLPHTKGKLLTITSISDYLKKPSRDKHSSLFLTIISDVENNCIAVAQSGNLIKPLYVSQMVWQNKLECLPLAIFFGLVECC
jgi:hypothetical protein